MKLVIVGIALIVLSLVLAHLAGINPVFLTFAGIACALIGASRGAPPSPVRDAEASPGAADDAAVLANYHFPQPEARGPTISDVGGAA
jgi:hypothetical protein